MSRSEPLEWTGADQTVNSGQVFLWEKRGPSWYGIDGRNIIRINPEPFGIESKTGDWGRLFRSGDDLGGIIADITKDRAVAKAVRMYPGLRLLRQDPFQCCISFMASSNSSIPCIRDRLRRICATFGKKTRFRGEEFRVFPRPRELAAARKSELLRCGLGYRAGFIKDASKEVAEGGLDLSSLRRSGYGRAREALIGIPGIGGKIADCVMLFALDKLEAFPIDRWTLRILERYYSRALPLPPGTLTAKKYAELHERVVGYFGPYAGYAQQFLFKMERDMGGGRWLQDRDGGPTPGPSTGSSRRR